MKFLFTAVNLLMFSSTVINLPTDNVYVIKERCMAVGDRRPHGHGTFAHIFLQQLLCV